MRGLRPLRCARRIIGLTKSFRRGIEPPPAGRCFVEMPLEELLEPAETRSLLAASGPSLEAAAVSNEQARPYELPVFDDVPMSRKDVDEAQVEIQIELGRAVLPADEAAGLQNGSVVLLDKVAADPVDVLADGRLIARGEVLVLNDRLCVRIAEVLGKPLSG